MARQARKFLVRRSKDNLSVVFARRAKRVGAHPLGNLQAVASSRTNRINLLNVEETEARGEDFFEIKNIHFAHWWTRNWNAARSLIARDVRVAAHTNQADVITELNNLTGYTILTAAGDEGGSGLSTVGGTSVVSFRMENVNYALEDGEGFLLDESSNKFVGEELNTVLQRSDGTFLSVDTRSVSHGGTSGGGGAGNPVTEGAVSGNTMTLTLDDLTTVDIDVTSLAGGGDVSGPGSSTNDAIARFDSTTGKILQNSGITVDDGNNVVGVNSLSVGLVSLIQNASIYFEGSTNDSFETQLTVTDPSADRILTLPNETGTVATQEYVATQIAQPVTIDLPNWYQQYDNPGGGSSTPGSQINTTTPSFNSNPYYFGVTLKRGREFAFDHSTGNETIYYGIWNGTTSYTPSGAGLASYWTKHLRISSANDEVRHGNNSFDSIGFDLTDDYSLAHGTTKLVLQYDYDSNKLKLWDVTYDIWYLIATASVAEDGNPVTITSSVGDGGSVPNFSDREQTYDIIAQTTAAADTTWRDGLLAGTVVKRSEGLHPGEKMVLTTPAAWINHYMGWDYTGASIGQSNPYNENTGSIQIASSEKLQEKSGFTINIHSQRYDTGTATSAMGGAEISWRYHLDYSMDLFDEDNEEILFTKDADLDGSTAYLHIYASTNVNIDNLLHAWSHEPFAATWFYNPNVRDKTAKANKMHSGISGPAEQIQWGEKMYPGQELIFQENQGGSGNCFLGVRNANNTDWEKYFSLDGTYISTTTSGFDITTQYGVQNKWLALRYDFADQKLKLYDTNTTGVETLITTATVAEDGNAIRIGVGGNNNVPAASTVLRYYGWEYIHTPTNHPQPWRNWRLDRPTPNDTLRNDTGLRQLRALLPGYFMRWTSADTATSNFHGGWKSSNASTGLTNIDQSPPMWDWGWRISSSEMIIDLKAMAFNTSNSNYDSGNTRWADPDKGNTQVQLRYNSDNSIDLYDYTNSAVIATKDDDGDGSGIYLVAGIGNNLTNISDNFFSGGDVLFGTL